MHRLTKSLIVRMILFGVMMVVTGSLVRFVMVSNVLRQGIQDIAAVQQLSMANYVAKDIDEKIRTRQQLLQSMAQELPPALLDQPPQLEAWLLQRHTHSPLFSNGIVVVPANGKGAIADYPPLTGRRDLDVSQYDWFRIARDKGEFAIGKPFQGRLTHQGVIVMAAPCRDAQGHVVAVIFGTTAIDTPGFLDLIQNNRIGESGGFLLISPRDKIFVAASEPQMRLKPTPPPGTNLMHDRAMTGWRGVGISVSAYGVEYVTAMASVPAADWFVVARLPTAEALRPVEGIPALMLRYTGLSLVLVVLILLAFLSYLFRPMKEAALQMRRMADGHAPLAKLPVVRQEGMSRSMLKLEGRRCSP